MVLLEITTTGILAAVVFWIILILLGVEMWHETDYHYRYTRRQKEDEKEQEKNKDQNQGHPEG